MGLAQAKAGKLDEAAKTVAKIDEKFSYLKPGVQLAIADAQIQAGDSKGARETLSRIEGEQRFDGFAMLVRHLTEKGQRDEAGKTIEESLRAAKDLADETSQDAALHKIAIAQADAGDVTGALRTAESMPGKKERSVDGSWQSHPFKELCLVAVRCRSGDFKGAREAADTIDDQYQEGYQKGNSLRVIARTLAEAKDVKGALATAAAIQHDFIKPATYIDIGRVLAKAGDRAGAANAFAKALELAQGVPEKQLWYLYWDGARSTLLRALAAAQAEAGEEATARAWIAKLERPYLKSWALVGLSEGAVKRAQTDKRP
jgi:tetratricopeptide (TPR) repeat protein